MFKTKKILRSVLLGLMLFIIVGIPVLAVPTDITILVAVPTDTTITLTWIKATAATSTRIRFLTTGYPTTATGTQIYDGISNTYVHSGLTSGTTYYYSVWGWDGAAYSATVKNIQMTTLALADAGDTLSDPTQPLDQKVETSAWFERLQPFTGMVAYFATDWGMPTNNMIYTFGLFILLLAGIFIYIKTKSPILAIGVDLIICLGLVNIDVLPPFTIGIVIIMGLGVWALASYAQG